MTAILIVDDDIQAIRQIRPILIEAGYDTSYLSQPNNIWEMLNYKSFNLILLDINMPVVDGISLLKQLKNHSIHHHIPVIMLTSETDDQILANCFNAGASDYLVKPAHRLVLEARVQNTLASRAYQQNLEKNLEDETQERKKLESKYRVLQKSMCQWQNLPDEIRISMRDLLMKFGDSIEILGEDLIQTLARMTQQYGETLSRFVEISRNRDDIDLNTRKRRIELLKALPLFHSLDTFDLVSLTDRIEVEKYDADVNVFIQDDPISDVFFIEEGRVGIIVDGKQIAERGAGESIGEMSCLQDQPKASATVRTLSSSRLLKISRQRFMEIVNRIPQLWRLLFLDATERLRDEIQARKQAELALQDSHQSLLKLNNDKDKFFSIVSHDLRSPFMGLIGVTEILAKKADQFPREKIIELSRDLHTASKRVLKLLENLLYWARIQTGRIDYHPIHLHLENLIHDNLHLYEHNAREKKIRMISTVEPETIAFADYNMIDSIFRNLLSNAIKFTKNGGEVKVFAKNGSKYVEIMVSDSGVGIPQEKINDLFRIDVQYTTKGTANESGTGLGLTLCNEMIEKNGGKFCIDSKPGEGSCFSFILPKPK